MSNLMRTISILLIGMLSGAPIFAQQQVQQLQIDDGHAKQAIDIDSDQPFAIVLPINAGSITFYDVNGNAVEYWNHPL